MERCMFCNKEIDTHNATDFGTKIIQYLDEIPRLVHFHHSCNDRVQQLLYSKLPKGVKLFPPDEE